MSSLPSNNDISVIIVTYNSRDDILPCLNSLKENAPPRRLQIIVIDNASTDKLYLTINAFRNSLSPPSELLVVYNEVNKGFTKAVNQGLALASAPFILFLNPDTVLPPKTIANLAKILQNDENIGVVAPQLRNTNGTVQPSCRRFPRHRDVFSNVFGLAGLFRRSPLFNGWKMGDFDHLLQRFVDQPQGACLLTRRDVVQNVGEWDETFPMFFSDVDWCQRIIRAGYKILFTPNVHVVHHKGKSVFPNRPAMILSSHRSFVRYFWKNYRASVWWAPNVFVSILLVFSGAIRYIGVLIKELKLVRK